MASPAPLKFTFYIAASPEKVWEGFVSKEANAVIFMGAAFEIDLKPGGEMVWSGPGPGGKTVTYVHGEVIEAVKPSLLRYRFGMGAAGPMSSVKVEMTPESEAVQVVVTNDDFVEGDPTYRQNADGWPRILSRLKTLLETGTTFKPH